MIHLTIQKIWNFDFSSWINDKKSSKVHHIEFDQKLLKKGISSFHYFFHYKVHIKYNIVLSNVNPFSRIPLNV